MVRKLKRFRACYEILNFFWRFRRPIRTIISIITQVEDYDYWIPQDPEGKKREICWIFFRWIPVIFLCFPAETGQKSSEKNPKIFQWEYCFHVPAISGTFLPEPALNFRPGTLEICCWSLFPKSSFDKSLNHFFKSDEYFDLSPARIKTFSNCWIALENQSDVDNLSIINYIDNSCCVSPYTRAVQKVPEMILL
jgi:hypothetical protein